MKKLLLFFLSFIVLIIIGSCNKTRQLNPAELVFTLNIDLELRPEAKYYLVLENIESKTQTLTLSNNMSMEILRGKDIIGGATNLHFILINGKADGDLQIKSFYSVPFGKTISIAENNLKFEAASETDVNLNFANVPAFDVISRTAKSQDQAYTLNTLETPLTTVANGGETFKSLELFYAYFQQGNSASYKTERIPDQANYTIDFSTLNTNMLKYSFPKTIDNAIIAKANVKSWDNQELYGNYLEVFNADDFSIFPNTSFEVFTPSFERYMSYYVQDFEYKKGNQSFRNWFYTDKLNENISLLDAGLSISTQTGDLPLIDSRSSDYSIAEIAFETEGFKWILYCADPSKIYIPEIPLDIFNEVNNANNLLELFVKINEGSIKLIDYYPYASYGDAVGYYFGSTNYKLKPGISYRTQEQIISL